MNDSVAKRQVPPFPKGGLGGISGYHDGATIKQNPPRPPFRKGGSMNETPWGFAPIAETETDTLGPLQPCRQSFGRMHR